MSADHYPHTPGWKARDTSIAAAKAVAPRAKNLRERVLACVTAQPGTPEQIAERLGLQVHSLRPRFTELSKLGKIVATDQRGPSMGGKLATVWRAA